MRAYVDESMRAGGTGPGLYVLAATVVPDGAAEPMRTALRALLPGSARRLHWREEREQLRLAVCRVLVEAGVEHHVVVCAPMDPRRQERARRRCLTALVWALHEVGVNELVLESRNDLDASDAAYLNTERARHRVPRPLVVEFGRPRVEPLLWAPDAVAGAVAASMGAGGDERYLAALGTSVTLVQVDGVV